MAQITEAVRLYIMPQKGLLNIELHTPHPKTGELPEGAKALDVSDAEAAARYVVAKAKELDIGIKCTLWTAEGYEHTAEEAEACLDQGANFVCNNAKFGPLMQFFDPSVTIKSKTYV